MSTGDAAVATYRHTQRGTRLVLIVVLTIVATVYVAIWSVRTAAARGGSPPPPGIWMAVATAVLVSAVAALSFSRLTIEVAPAELRWRFVGPVGSGRIVRDEIARVEPTTTKLLTDGLGIHRTRRGWVYNVSLGPAVLVERRDGRTVILGTDDPGGLLAALRR